jgi:predicted GIY-YIG superfamily endonuclease
MASSGLLRDRLLARRRDGLDDRQLAAEVLGIRGAPPELARKLVAQALVLEDRRDAWQRTGERICADAPVTPGVYILKDEDDRVLYVGKAVNLRRRLRAHFSGRRWRATKAALTRASGAEWIEVGSELEALLREASFIAELMPSVNVQRAAPAFDTRAVPDALVREVVLVLPSVEADSAELVAARPDGAWMIQRTRRNGADLAVHAKRLWKFFSTADSGLPTADCSRLAPIVYSWLAGRGRTVTRLDPRADAKVAHLRARLAALLRDERLFHERLEQC